MTQKIRVIELTGAPGAGKTTLFKKMKTEAFLRSSRVLFYDDRQFLPEWLRTKLTRTPRISQILSRLVILSKNISQIQKTGQLRNLRHIWNSRQSISNKLSLSGNILLKAARSLGYTDFSKYDVIFVDEGLSHSIFNLADYRSKIWIPSDQVFSPLKNITKDIEVWMIITPKIELKNRISQRGHARLNRTPQLTLEEFVELNQVLAEDLKKNGRKFFRSFVVGDEETILQNFRASLEQLDQREP